MKKIFIFVIIGMIIFFLYNSILVKRSVNKYEQSKFFDRNEMIKVRQQFAQGIINSEFQMFFDRDPERHIPSRKNIIVAPGDGDIVSILHDRNTFVIQIHVSLRDVHVQRVPISGKVMSVDNAGSGYLPVTNPLFFNNAQKITTLDTDIGPVIIKQITGVLEKRIKVFVKQGQKVKTGERLGRIILGSTVILIIPDSVRLIITPKQRVVAGETIIGTY